MSATKIPGRTPWHPLFAALLTENRPPGVEVQSEVVLSHEPRRADLLLIHHDDADLSQGKVLRGLWPLLSPWTLVEFKSATAPAGPTAWLQLLSYGTQFHGARFKELGPARHLTLVLATPKFNRALQEDAAGLGVTYESLGHGYYRALGFSYPCFLVVLHEVAADEEDPLLQAFTGATIESLADPARWWLISHLFGRSEVNMADLEGYEELAAEAIKKLPAKLRLAGLAVEERLAGLAVEERLAGLDASEQLLLNPDEVLRALSADYIRTLPAEVQAEIRRRLSH